MRKQIIHGQFIRNMDTQLISEEDTCLWHSRGDLKRETESEITAAQDQALQTKYHATKVLQTERVSKCRRCKQFDETVEHIITCPVLANEQYVKRHDRVYAQLHFNKCREIRVKLENNTSMVIYQNQLKQVMKVKLPFYGPTCVNRQNHS